MVSIVSPLYNVAPYIRDCIDSIKAQTMQDFEVLFIDDHGNDDSIAIAQAYTEGDDRFRFLATPKNSGPGIARNIGIEAARGEYISFIDSDDVIAPTFLEKLYAAAHSSDSLDLAFCQLAYRGGARDGQTHRNPVVPSGPFASPSKRYFLSHFVTFSVCFLFRREFLLSNQLRFPSERNSEDTNFLTRCLLAARTIACVDEPLYLYCIREQSLTTGRNPNRWKQRLSAANKLMSSFQAMKSDPKFHDLQLSQYNGVMALLWLKKGLAQAIREFFSKKM